MCGIAGMISAAPAHVADAALRRMVEASRHRGPDGSGTVTAAVSSSGSRVLLGHARLRILDLSSRSDQPMADAATGSWLVYNGEIYNFRELKRELITEGARFHSSGDTEVVLQSLLRWGEKAVERLDGMFAFAFWDGRSKQLLLGRDRVGIKPLYYMSTPGLFLFASEVKIIRAAGLAELAVNRAAVEAVLTMGAVIGPGTIYQQVRELEPAHVICVSDDAVVSSDREYWSVLQAAATDTDPSDSFEREVEMLHDALTSAVARQLVSDVPVGIFLSGGVDSSLISLLASRQRHSDLKLLTVAFEERDHSELGYAHKVSRSLDLPHEFIVLSESNLDSYLAQALSAFDQPTVDGINTFVVSSVGASLGMRVLLSGLGGDEVFGGYSTFRKIPMLLSHPSLMRLAAKLISRFSLSHSIQWQKLAHSRWAASITDAYLLQRSLRWISLESQEARDSYIPPNWRVCLESLADDYRRIAALELLFYVRYQLLRDADVFSMANSTEVRVPLLDTDVISAALRLPQQFHFDGHGGKRIPRQLLKKGIPAHFFHRRKQGFVLPWPNWLLGHLRQFVDDTLHEIPLYDQLAIDSRTGMELWASFQTGDPTVSWHQIWSLFALLNWQHRNRQVARPFQTAIYAH